MAARHLFGKRVRACTGVLILAAAFLTPATAGQSRNTQQTRRKPPSEMGERPGEEYERNREWFYQQRAYPFNSIPPDARRKAVARAIEILPRPSGAAGSSPVVPGNRGTGAPLTWKSIGPAPTAAYITEISPVSGRIRAVAISPDDPDIVIAGATCGGLWRSSNGGNSFQPVSDDQVDLSVGAIAFAPSNPNTVYAAMGLEYLGSGVLKSTDAGRTWRKISNDTLPTPGIAEDILVDPADAKRVYVAQLAGQAEDGFLYSSGFHLSTDGGVNWTRTLTGLANDIAVSPANPRTLYLAMSRVDEGENMPGGIYRSVDGGLTWSHFHAGQFDVDVYPTYSIATTPADPNRIYAFGTGFAGNVYTSAFAVSTNAGQSWTISVPTALPMTNPTFLEADPRDPLTVYIGYPGGDLFKSTNGGQSWTCLSQGYCDGRFASGDKIHVDQHAFAVSPATSDRIYVGNDGGLYRSDNAGSSWQPLNATLSLVTFRGITIHPLNPAISFGGTQDNGVQRRSFNSNIWNEIITGDGGPVIFDPEDPAVYFTTYIYGSIYRWRDDEIESRVTTNATFGEGPRPRIAFYPPFVNNGVASRLYFGAWRLFVSDDQGETWTAPAGSFDQTKGPASGDVLTAIGVSASNPDVIYSGSARGRVMASSDAGLTWRDANTGLPDRFVTSITVDRGNPDVAWLTVSGFRSGHVFKTTNRGLAWTDVSGSLPDIPANALLQDITDPTTLYLGTDIGVFRSRASGNTWEYFNSGLPPVIVLGFATHASGIVQLATYGRGAYELGVDANPDPDFRFGFDKPTVSVQRGKSVSLNAIVERIGGFADQVTVSGPDVRALKLKLKPSSGSTAGTTVGFTIKAKKAAAPGTYVLEFKGRSSSGVERTAGVQVTVE